MEANVMYCMFWMRVKLCGKILTHKTSSTSLLVFFSEIKVERKTKTIDAKHTIKLFTCATTIDLACLHKIEMFDEQHFFFLSTFSVPNDESATRKKNRLKNWKSLNNICWIAGLCTENRKYSNYLITCRFQWVDHKIPWHRHLFWRLHRVAESLAQFLWMRYIQNETSWIIFWQAKIVDEDSYFEMKFWMNFSNDAAKLKVKSVPTIAIVVVSFLYHHFFFGCCCGLVWSMFCRV